MSNLIRANKCVLGETYYLTGMWYDYNIKPISYIPYITSKGNKPLINTPVIFVGRDKNGSHGKHRFMFTDGSEQYIKMYASDDLFIKPVDNPDVLKDETKRSSGITIREAFVMGHTMGMDDGRKEIPKDYPSAYGNPDFDWRNDLTQEAVRYFFDNYDKLVKTLREL